MEKGRIEFDDPTFREYQDCLERFENSDLGIFDKHFGDLPIGMRTVCAERGQRMVEDIRHRPLDMLIFCPVCHKQHLDQPEPDVCERCGSTDMHFRDTDTMSNPQEPCRGDFHYRKRWTNPPHKSHWCNSTDGGCGNIFRVADFPTNGVKAIQTKGKDDTWDIHIQSTGD